MKYDLVEEFNKALENDFLSYSLGAIYGYIFELLTKEELRIILENYQNQYEEDPENWFHSFHKSIRQTDFIQGIIAYREVNKLTPEQNKERDKLLKEFRKNPEPFVKGTDKHRDLVNLNQIALTEERVRVCGTFDGILWHQIHLDEKNELKEILEKIFRICTKPKSKQRVKER